MMLYLKIKEQALPFLDYIFNALEGIKCEVCKFELDHICYRVSSEEEYVAVKRLLKDEGGILSENQVNGREITIFKLRDPIVYRERLIDVFELPSPKEASKYASGFEHVEFVIDRELRNYVQDNPHLNFNTKGIDKTINPEIRLNFEKGVVKFHCNSLLEVIESEK